MGVVVIFIEDLIELKNSLAQLGVADRKTSRVERGDCWILVVE